MFLDETAITTSMVRTRGRCPRGDRLVDYAPHGHWKTVTFIAGLRHDKVVAPFVIEGAMNGETFRAYIEQCLAPTLKPGDTVVLDNVSTHKVNGVAEAIEMVGTQSWCSARSSNSTPVMSVSTGVRSAAGQFGSPKTRLLFNTAPSRSFRRDRPRDLVSGGTMGASFGSLGAW